MKHNQLLVTAIISTVLSTSAFSYGGFVKDSYGNYVQSISGCVYYGDISAVKEQCPLTATPKAPMQADSKPAMAKESSNMAANVNSNMAAPEPVVKEVINLDGVTFKTGSNQLTGASLNTLDSVAQQLKAKPGTKIIVVGHTDNRGDSSKNLKLSQARAETVMEHLITQGVGASQLTARGYGDTEAVASNDTNEGRAKNRRVELRILK